MIEIIFGGAVYMAALVSCYDGDTCKISFASVPPFLSVQTLRFDGFDTPEMRGKCAYEKQLAKSAREMTRAYMQDGGRLIVSGKRGKYGRLLVAAPELKTALIDAGLARHYLGGRRGGWCGQ